MDNTTWSSYLVSTIMLLIWRHRSESTLTQIITCWLMGPSHYLNQCWVIINEVLWHSPKTNSQEVLKISIRKLDLKNTLTKSRLHLSGDNKLRLDDMLASVPGKVMSHWFRRSIQISQWSQASWWQWWAVEAFLLGSVRAWRRSVGKMFLSSPWKQMVLTAFVQPQKQDIQSLSQTSQGEGLWSEKTWVISYEICTKPVVGITSFSRSGLIFGILS